MQPLFGLITQHNLSETGIEAVVWWVQTMATKETTVCVAPMHLIFPYTYLDNRDSRLHNICVTSDKLVFYPSFCNIFFFFENYALFSDKNDNIEYTDCPISTHPAKNITLARYACLCLK